MVEFLEGLTHDIHCFQPTRILRELCLPELKQVLVGVQQGFGVLHLPFPHGVFLVFNLLLNDARQDCARLADALI